jgi:hypothetical protein
MIHHSIYKEKEGGLTVGFINKFVQDPGILLKLIIHMFPPLFWSSFWIRVQRDSWGSYLQSNCKVCRCAIRFQVNQAKYSVHTSLEKQISAALISDNQKKQPNCLIFAILTRQIWTRRNIQTKDTVCNSKGASWVRIEKYWSISSLHQLLGLSRLMQSPTRQVFDAMFRWDIVG